MPVCVGAGRSAAGPTPPAAAMQHRRRGCSAGPHPARPPGPAPGTAGHSPGEDLRQFAVWSETTWRGLFFQKKARKRPRELWLRWPPPVFSCSLARRAQYPKDKSRAYWNRGTDSVCLRLCGSVSIINRFAASSDWSRGRFFCVTHFSVFCKKFLVLSFPYLARDTSFYLLRQKELLESWFPQTAAPYSHE